MNKETYRDILDSAAADSLSRNSDLWPKLAAQIQNNKSPLRTLRAHPAGAILMALVVLLALSGVAYAIGKSLGYVPGVGIVNQNAPVRVLAEPVTVEQDGLTITVSNVVADSERTFIAYSVDGIVVPARAEPMLCGVMPALHLPNGAALNVITEDDGGPLGGMVGSTLKVEQSVTYAFLPADVNTVTLTFPCVLPDGKGPQNWQVPLTLSPAPKDFATPAVEIGATAVSQNPGFVIAPTATTDMRVFTPEPTGTIAAASTPAAQGSGLHLDKVIELPGSYILVGNFTDAGDLPGAVEFNVDPNADLPHIEDGAGNPVPFKVRADLTPEMGPGVRYWAYEIAKPVNGPVKISLDLINISKSYTFEFNFDVGAHPQVGQKLDLNLPVHLGNYQYVLDSVTVIENGYLFRYHSGKDAPEGTSLAFNILGHTSTQDSSSVNSAAAAVEYSETLTFASPLPASVLTVDLTSMESSPLPGPWVLTWTPPGQ
jgi:hypothetical protein